MSRIALGYIGVHQIFQLALAAQEIGELNAFYCSLTANGRFGRLFGRFSKSSASTPLDAEKLTDRLVHEFPWPIIGRKAWEKLFRPANTDYYWSNSAFDRYFARKITQNADQIKVCVASETCALHSHRAARELGMRTVLECPGIPKEVLTRSVLIASEDLGIAVPSAWHSTRMDDQKRLEISQADELLLCSEVQKNYYKGLGIKESSLHVNPLWVDPVFRSYSHTRDSYSADKPIRLLYVGRATLAKGFPYLLQAMQKLHHVATLTVCGGIDAEIQQWSSSRFTDFTVIPWLTRKELARVYSDHDVLVFPTLGDSFGFVALEAMHCGLPVIATRAAGVPLPDDSWRVPERASDCIAERVHAYCRDRELLQSHREMAKRFSRTFTPEAYRERAGKILTKILETSSGTSASN